MSLAARGLPAVITSAFVLLVGLACSGIEQPWSSDPPPVEVDAGPAPELAPPGAPIVSPARDGALVTGYRVSFVRPVGEGQRTKPATGTVIALEPPADGELWWEDERTLRFTAKGDLAPSTVYTVTVREVRAADGVSLAPGPGETWGGVFETPAFAADRMVVAGWSEDAGTVVTLVDFAGAVDASAVKAKAALSHRGAGSPSTLRITKVEQAGPGRVRVSASGLPREAGVLTLELAAGIPGRSSVLGVAPAATLTAAIDPEARTWSVVSAEVDSRDDGNVIRVYCTDEAVQTTDVWSDGDYVEVAIGCGPDVAQAADTIRLEPEVPFTLVPKRGGFELHGDFRRGPATMVFAPGALGSTGSVLVGTDRFDLEVPPRRPAIAFAGQGRYLPRALWGAVPIQSINVSEATIRVRHVPEPNLTFWATDWDEELDDFDSDLIAEGPLQLSAPADTAVASMVDVAALVPEPQRGLYEFMIRGEDGGRATLRTIVTDLQIIAKRPKDAEGDRSVEVWVVRADDLSSVTGASVEVVRSSGTSMGTCTTDASGGCTVPLVEAVDPRGPFGILVRHGADLSWMELDDLRIRDASSDVWGAPFTMTTPYLGYAYTDRGVYRPGDTVQLGVIVRDDARRAVAVPLVISVRDPSGKEVRKSTVTTNEAGLATWSVKLEDFAATGSWSIRALAGTEDLAGVAVSVEEFVPERLKVSAASVDPAYRTDVAPELAIQARYLFGAPAAGNRVDVACVLRPGSFTPEAWKDYSFGVPAGSWRAVELGVAEATLDAQGTGKVRCLNAPAALAPITGPARVDAVVDVFEAGSGRTTQAVASAQVHPAPHYIGLRYGASRAEPHVPLTVSGVVVDWDGALATGVRSVEIQPYRVESEYGWAFDPSTGEERWRTSRRVLPDGPVRTVAVEGGRFAVSVTPSAGSSAFAVQARAGDAVSEAQVDGRRWYWDEYMSSTPSPLEPKPVPIEAPESVTVGEKATVTFTAPFPGRMLATVETDDVLVSEWVDVPQAGPVTWTFKIDAFTDDVFVTGLVLKSPHAESADAWIADRGFGVTRVRVKPVKFTHDVQIQVPEVVRSSSTLDVGIEVAPTDGPTWVTVAAVDVGILQITKFKTPDPQLGLFPERALGVETYETVGWALGRAGGGTGKHGGDGDDGGDALGRVQMVKPVALWSGPVQVPSNGKVSIPFEIPNYRGALRVMVVSTSSGRTGSASAEVTVRDPVVVQSTVPRFLSAGDVFSVPVTLTNVSGGARTVDVSLAVSALEGVGVDAERAPVVIEGPADRKVSLADGASEVVLYSGRVTGQVGAARFEIVAKSGEDRVTEALDVPILASGPEVSSVQRIALRPGKNDLGAVLDTSWLPTSEQTSIWVTSNPYGEALRHLRYLVHYPHGCLEQTSSSLLPLLHVRSLLPAVVPDLAADAAIDDMVKKGLSRVLAMQTPNGGFSMWPGGTSTTDWGSAYAVIVLHQAKAAGHPVPDAVFESAGQWLEQRVAQAQTASGAKEGLPAVEAWMHYAAALGGKGNKARIEELLAARARESGGAAAEDVLLLQAALYRLGDRRHESALRTPALTAPAMSWANDARFYSDVRRLGLNLVLHQDLIGADDAAAGPLADVLARALEARGSAWWSTQDLGWAITGLGRRVGKPASFGAPSLAVAGKAWRASTTDTGPGKDTTWLVPRASERSGLVLDLPSADGAVWAFVESRGVRPDASWEVRSDGLSVSRELVDQNGGAVDPRALRQGDVVYVKVRITNTSPSAIPNLVVVDRIPAGLEIENPRLDASGQAPSFARGAWTGEHMDVRDDRVAVFGTLGRGASETIVYAARAVTAGTFGWPPTEAAGMYAPDLAATGQAGSVVVLPFGG